MAQSVEAADLHRKNRPVRRRQRQCPTPSNHCRSRQLYSVGPQQNRGFALDNQDYEDQLPPIASRDIGHGSPIGIDGPQARQRPVSRRWMTQPAALFHKSASRGTQCKYETHPNSDTLCVPRSASLSLPRPPPIESGCRSLTELGVATGGYRNARDRRPSVGGYPVGSHARCECVRLPRYVQKNGTVTFRLFRDSSS
jgi:hypothetical protein